MSLRTKLLVLLVLVIILGISFKYYHCNCTPTPNRAASIEVQTASQTTPSITIGSTKINVLIADTDALRTQGLSGRDSLPANTGMLFIFEDAGQYGFWMKDMKFSLDMIWIDSNGHVIQVDKDISPETYPTVFWPSKAVKYVLEVPAGFAKGHQIDTGSQVYFAL